MPQLVVALLATAGVPGLATTVAGVTTLTALGTGVASGIGVGLSVGLSILAGELFAPPEPKAIKATISEAVAYRSRHYGLQCGGCARAAIEDENGNLHQVLMFGEGPFTEYMAWIVDERELTLTGATPNDGGWATGAPFDSNEIFIDPRWGTPDQPAFDLMIDRLPAIWTPDHQLKGVACAHLYQDGVAEDRFPDIYPNRISQLKWVAKTSSVFDPRDSSTGFSSNLPLIWRDYATHARGARIPVSLIDDDYLKVAADDADDEGPIKAGGTIPRYHGAMSYSFGERPKDVMDRLLLAMDGRTFLTPQGKIGLQVGKWIPPTVHITDQHIRKHRLRRGNGPFVEKNEIIVQYTAPETRFSRATADPWRNEASIGAYGLRTGTVPAYEIRHHNHSRRIAKILEARSAPKFVGDIVTDLFGMEAWDQRWINLSIDIWDIDEAPFEVLAIGIDEETQSVVMTVASFDGEQVYSFNPETEEGTAQAIPLDLEKDPIEDPASVTAVVELKTLSSITTTDSVWNGVDDNDPVDTDHDVKAYVLNISWPAPARRGLRPVVQYAVSGSGAWRDVTVATGLNETDSPALVKGEAYSSRVKFVTIGGTPSEWEDASDQTVPG